MQFLKQLFNEAVAQAICRTLVHSLWQGLLLAIVAAIVILLTRKAGPAIRYNLLSILFGLFFLGACTTFFLQLHSSAGKAGDGRGPGVIANGALQGGSIVLEITEGRSGREEEGSLLQRSIAAFGDYCNEHAYLVVAVWLVVLSARFIKILASLAYIQRLKHYKVSAVSRHWMTRVQELADQLRIKARVGLLESELIKIPLVVGFLKPIILIPFGLLSQIPPDQVEAVLLHELAHVRRKDYFVNLIQSFTELLFFFNPGVRWVSSLIRDEREHCCDDIAIVQTKNREQFVKALIAFQEYYNAGSHPAMGFPGRKGSLLLRVRRIIHNNNKTLNNMEKLFVAGSLVITSFLTLTVLGQKAPQPVTSNNSKSAGPMKTISPAAAAPGVSVAEAPVPAVPGIEAPVPAIGSPVLPVIAPVAGHAFADTNGRLLNGVYDMDENGTHYRVFMDGDSLLVLYINGRRISGDRMDEYRPKVNELWQRMKEQLLQLQDQSEDLKKLAELTKLRSEDARSIASLDKVQAEKAQEMALLAKLRSEDAMKETDLLKGQMEAISLDKEKLRKEAMLLKLQAEDSRRQSDLLKLRAEEMTKGDSSLRRQAEIMKTQAEELRLQSDLMKLQAEKAQVNVKVMQDEAQKMKLIALRNQAESNKLVGDITNDLVREKVIKNKKELKTLSLSDEGLEVNGVRQDDGLFKKFKERYMKGEQTRIHFDLRDDGKHINISQDK